LYPLTHRCLELVSWRWRYRYQTTGK